MGTDFFDDDLARQRKAALKIKLDGEGADAPRDGYIPPSRDLPNRPIGDLTLSPLARHKQEVTDQMVDKAQELGRLRARQEELERERRTLEELRHKQEAFDVGRREMKDRLSESLVRMEKEQLQSERLTQMLEETRRLFRERMADVTALNEEDWEDEDLLDELSQALSVLENIRSDYNKAMARLDAVQPHAAVAASAPALACEDAPARTAQAQSFRYWLKAGLAFTLPLMVTWLVAVLIFSAVFLWM
ncbi:MAG: hypothetical protein LBN38_06975 [Verrucomicrobiota bacterium]|jgi:DNA repair exonuclease SbcCD ATPase subunit|nr:hypothetical protein [Verrucomicrobiota bacterium]